MVRRIAAFLLALAVGCQARDQPTTPTPVEGRPVAGLDGRWRVVSSVTDGVPDPDEVGTIHEFRGDALTVTAPEGGGGPVTYEVALRPETEPMEMDLIYDQQLAANGPLPASSRKQAILCVYKADGDTLTICGSTYVRYCRGELCETARPADFTGRGAKQTFLHVLRRAE